MALKIALTISVLAQCLIGWLAMSAFSEPDPHQYGGIAVTFASELYSLLAALILFPLTLWSARRYYQAEWRLYRSCMVVLPLLLLVAAPILVRTGLISWSFFVTGLAIIPTLVMLLSFATIALRRKPNVQPATNLYILTKLFIIMIIPMMIAGIFSYFSCVELYQKYYSKDMPDNAAGSHLINPDFHSQLRSKG